MKDTSEGFFNTAVNCPSALLCSAAFYEAPPPRHFFRGPLNVVTDRQGVLIADLERLNENSIHALHLKKDLLIRRAYPQEMMSSAA
ncbi:hypothetical protein EVAR_92816_1 [Eumeta japonica]|uniref:Uncharacterized protein n=1 Tax=Eumeta variegata TaxID=151549 RepID=A0A4C1TAV2_EUMVA|nr:hypothetical protein EVAR_92816_1 [Eumeta japonica]